MEKINSQKENFICSENKIRLDKYLNKIKPEYSRSFFYNLIHKGYVSVNLKVQNKAGYLLELGDEIEIRYPKIEEISKKNIDNFDIKIIFDSADFMIINKGPGVLVHSPGLESGEPTLVDWILEHIKYISGVGSLDRPGIVHRLDKDTSGLMIIPKTNAAHKAFGDMFKDRNIQKTYLAVVKGSPEKSGEIDFDIVRHPVSRHKMTHVPKHEQNKEKYAKSRESYTKYKVLKYFDDAALVEAKPKTGRTHQIRVHFASINHPLIGDVIYGKQSPLINRQALHAQGLEFEYNGKKYKFEADPPEDFAQLIKKLS
ncbi:hypothetical protein A3F66_06945 [candidate division TM6 bacterium RIFCSPHIGHO2_12_FULL_32_22]|nr:MAG: hypothetical protein A3F66_06945 [candidate division TM6 bacterium RIFCSPHIGHO2_12_FULL_32_22]